MDTEQSISLNFFPLDLQQFQFTVYRRRYEESERSTANPGRFRYRLPDGNLDDCGEQVYSDYWVSFNEQTELEPFLCSQSTNNALTCSYLFALLKNTCEANLQKRDEYRISEKRFRSRRIEFNVGLKPGVGRQVVWLEPYFLKSRRLFGFLLDFAFQESNKNTDTIFARKLSLSLDKNGRSNRNYYSDRYDKIREFVTRFHDRIFSIRKDISIVPSFVRLDANTLDAKSYVFSSGASSKSQFTGIRDIGPLRLIDSRRKVYFVFQEADRPFSHDLFRALRGDTFPRRFPGMEKMFGFVFDRSNVGGMPIESFTFENVRSAISAIQRDANGRLPVLLLVSPFDKFSKHQVDRSTYMQIKHLCLTHKIPCQFVSIPLMRKKQQFEWAVSSIGLQVFAKMGGWPWQVQHKTPKCLIVGISQAHQKQGGQVKKYFAYSTFTDSSGIYKELKVLSETEDHHEYMISLKRNLMRAIRDHFEDFDCFVLHTTFAIRRNEMEAIKSAISELESDDSAHKIFTIMKFNDDNRFFGYAAENNSMVPYESSYIQLSRNEFVIWFEGLQYHNDRVPANLERPVHIKFIYPIEGISYDQRKAYMQDALNISGANWRGFNAKSLPISIFYSSLVAQYYRDCKRFGLADIDFETITPWFL